MLGFGNRKKGFWETNRPFSPLDSLTLSSRRNRFRRSILILAFIVLVAAVSEFPVLNDQTGQYDIDAENTASKTIRALFSFEAEDLESTRDKRDEAAAKVPEAYSVDVERVKSQLLNLNQRIIALTERRDRVAKAVQKALLASTDTQSREEVVADAVSQLAVTLKSEPLFEGSPEASALSVWLMPDLRSVPKPEFEEAPSTDDQDAPPRGVAVRSLLDPEDPEFRYANLEPLTALARDGLEYVLTVGVIQQSAVPLGGNQGASTIQILRGRVPDAYQDVLSVSEERELNSVPDAEAARLMLRRRMTEFASKLQAEEPEKAYDWEQFQVAAFEMAALGIIDTLSANLVVTEGNRQLARSNIPPITRVIDANRVIQEEGYPWNPQSRADAKTFWRIIESGQKSGRSIFSPLFANAIFVILGLLCLTHTLPVFTANRANADKSLQVGLLLMCATLVLGRVVSIVDSTGILVPIMAAAILLTILTDTRTAALVSVMTAFILSFQYGQDWRLLVISCAMSFGGISGLYIVRKRGDIARASVRGAAIGLVALLAVSLATSTLVSWATMQLAALVVLNGAACLFIVPGLLSPLERMFGITTDIQLLEYSDLNNEILSRLAIEVPATHAHSLMLGQLAEAAADTIGANGLLARVCAYYHDVGKMRRPEYFNENQTGQNIHEELSPRLSARAISSHVAEGVEIARECHLPEPIIAGIREHHGTSLIGFFYQQALEQQKHGDVREEDYRYPGPKPQSRETAILMICDGVESGVRSIKNPNEERIREFVDKIISTRSLDRQFDECGLTLKDLDTVGDVIAKRIMTTLHTRIAYPERKVSNTAKNVIPMTGGHET